MKASGIKLTDEQVQKARRMAGRDYEIRKLLFGYLDGVLDDEGVRWLLEEIGETQIGAAR